MSRYSSRYSRRDGNRQSKQQQEKDRRLRLAKKKRKDAWHRLLGIY